MKIEIETKYNIGDIVIAYQPQRGFAKYKIVDIRIGRQSVNYRGGDIEYSCRLLTNGNLSCSDSFTENELFTESDIYERLRKFMTYPTSTDEAKHDIDIYVGLKDMLRNVPTIAMSNNVHPSEYTKWLESKFPEIEQHLKYNSK